MKSSDYVPEIPIVEISVAPVVSSNVLALEVVGVVLVVLIVVCSSIGAVLTGRGPQGDIVQVGGAHVRPFSNLVKGFVSRTTRFVSRYESPWCLSSAVAGEI